MMSERMRGRNTAAGHVVALKKIILVFMWEILSVSPASLTRKACWRILSRDGL